MTRLPVVLAFVVALLAPLGLGGHAAQACPVSLTRTSVANADVVFVGAISSVDGGDAVFAVDRVYKGEAPSLLTLSWDDYGRPAFSDEVIGQSWLIFVTKHGREYRTSECSSNRVIADADGHPFPDEDAVLSEVKAITGRGHPTQEISMQEFAHEQLLAAPWALVLPLTLAILLAVLLVPPFLRKPLPGGY